MSDIIFNNPEVQGLAKEKYSMADIVVLEAVLIEHSVFDFEVYPESGLFPATHSTDDINNYKSVWLRDTVHIANALLDSGMIEAAQTAVLSLVSFHAKSIDRWRAVIKNPALASEAMNRPHVRFDGVTLSEIDQKWSHAQNDAIGYFLWILVKVLRKGSVFIDADIEVLLEVIPRYLNAIKFWQDADSGHWEEEQKIEASSIGCCIAGLEALVEFCSESDATKQIVGDEVIELCGSMITTSRNVFDKMLPNESVATDDNKGRDVDAALLFLCFPLNVVTSDRRDQIRENIGQKLQGDYGIRRYLGDSFWTKNYPDLMAETDLTRDFSDDIDARNKLAQVGEEAQWCIFDSILSASYGIDFLNTKDKAAKELQVFYFNRAIGQITGPDCALGEFLMPEAYYLQGDQYIANDATPLQWAKANLIQAFRLMKLTH